MGVLTSLLIPMKLVFDYWMWNYNLCDTTQKSFKWYITITEDNWNNIKVWENYPRIEYSIDEDDSRHWLNDERDDFFSLRDNFEIEELFNKAYKYISHMWSTKDYMWNLLLFEKMFTENYEELRKDYITNRNKEVQREIERLQSQIVSEDDYTNIPQLSGKEKEINKINKSIEYYEKEMSQYKEWTDWYLKAEKSLQENKDKLIKLS